MKITIKDIARIANVSIGTASLALNGKECVNEQTRKRIVEIAEQYNYTPNHSARSLITKKSNCIGLMVSDISNPFFANLVDEFNKLVERHSYTLLLGVSGDRIATEQKYVEMFISKNVEGVILVPTIETRPDLKHLYHLKNLCIPFVFCTAAYYGLDEPCVMTDLRSGQYQIVKHLLSRGLRKIYVITGNRDLQLARLRLDGYIQAFEEANLTYQSKWIVETVPGFQHGYEAAEQILADRPEAIVCVNDYLAMGVLKALKDHGVRVPRDVSVAGYDDLLFSSIAETPLTTVRQPVADICRTAMEVLMRRIEGEPVENAVYFLPPELKIRESTL